MSSRPTCYIVGSYIKKIIIIKRGKREREEEKEGKKSLSLLLRKTSLSLENQ
jgi:hypothetical protein